MPTATKRRKTGAGPRKPVPQGGINSFAQVSKTTTIANVSKSILDKNSVVDSVVISISEEQPLNSRKRKTLQDDEDAPISITGRNVKSLPQKRSNDLPSSPHTPEPAHNLSPVSSIDTPTKGARTLLDKFFLSQKPKPLSPLSDSSFSSTLDASTPKHKSPTPAELPTELLDLINLHASFLTALSIHYAHNGTHSPADLRMLCPDVARAWGKRRVLVDDIRRTLGVLNSRTVDGKDSSIASLSLSDYGHGKICVELQAVQGKAGRIERPINENILNECFVAALKTMWEKEEEQAVEEFVGQLPMEPIKICASLTKISPLLAKGQQRLDDLRMGITAKKEEKKQKVEERQTGPKMTLLERLRAKQLHQSTLAPPPTKEELARRAALGRMDEVVAVLFILSTSGSIGQSRVSFTLPTVLSKLKDSFRTPISKIEAETCMRLLAAEIAPEWVRIVKMGKVEALVVNRDQRPSEEDIRGRVQSRV